MSRLDARRLAVRAQLLDRPRPTGLLDMVRQLTLLQIDPIAAIAPNADLVAWSRLGSSYSPAELGTALADRTLLELRAMIRPREDLALYRAATARWDQAEHGELPGWRASRRDWVRANHACRLDILDRLGSCGPLPSRELPDTCQVPWQLTGWTNNRNVTQPLEFVVLRGEVAIACRRDGDRLRALGIARARGPECPVEPADVGEAGEAAVVEGVKGTWRVDEAGLASRSRGGRRCCPPSTGWWASSTPPPTAKPGCCGSRRCTRTRPSTRP